MTITPARLREIAAVDPGRTRIRQQHRDLLTLIRELLEPEPGCGFPKTLCGTGLGFPDVRHAPDCPVTAHRTRRASLRQAMED